MDFEELNKAAPQGNEPTRIDRALERFANMMIERLEASKEKNWEQGWTSGTTLMGLPQNIKGWTYVGGNAFLLQMHTMTKGYHVPVYMTAKQARENGALIKKGEPSVPVFKWGLNVKDENGKRLSEEKFLLLSKDEQEKCQVRPYLKVYNEWNIDQTTLEEVNKKKYDAILSRFNIIPLKDDVGMYKNAPLDRMFEKQEWLCPIQVNLETPGASYNKSRDFIKVPKKAQFNIHEDIEEIFKDGQEFYSSALHEMAHSTGHPSRLDRLPQASFGSEEYAKEELVAETTAFVIGNALGFSSRISENNAAYVDSWIKTLREQPKFIVTIMSDVNKASRMILEEIDKQKIALGEKALLEGNLDGIDEQIKNDKQLEEMKQQKEQNVETPDNSKEKSLSSAEAYFSSLIKNITSDTESEHTVLAVESIPELRAYFQDNEVLGSWIDDVSDEKLLSLGANLLPKLHAHGEVNETIKQNGNMNDSDESKGMKDDSQKRDYYFSYQYLQSTDSTDEFDRLTKLEKWEDLLVLAEQYDQGDSLLQKDTFKNAARQHGDDLLVENDHYAIVYNNTVGGTYELLRRVSEQDIQLSIERYGLESDASQDVKNIANTMESQEVEQPIRNGKVDAQQSLSAETKKEEEAFLDADVKSQMEAELDAIDQNFPEDHPNPHEDSDITTDVAGKAEQIAATGVPMHEAEKEAKAIIDDEKHSNYHEEKSHMIKQEEEKKQQEMTSIANENAAKKEKKSEAHPASHADLLLAALERAKNHDGVWMNEKGKENAAFLDSFKPITAFNNIMMNLQSDLEGFNTNLYSSYNKAKENDMPVMRGQTSLPFNWTKWEYQNVADHTDTISREEYNSLPDMEKTNYAIHANRQRHHVYNIDQTILSSSDAQRYSSLIKEKGPQIENFVSKLGTSSEQKTLQYVRLHEVKNPETVIMVKKDNFYEVFGEKAKVVSPIIGIASTEKDIAGEKVAHLSFPSYALDTVLPKMIRAGNRVAICDTVHEPKLGKQVIPATSILSKAYQTAENVAKSSGIKYERVMVLQDAKFDNKANTLTISGMSKKDGNEHVNAIMKANDIYRAVVATTGVESRLDRSGRNNFLPDDDAKHEMLVRELTAGVMMARQGLPATFSQDSQKLIPYWERELRENRNLMGIIERDVNLALETIDNLAEKRKVNYEAIRGQLPSKDVLSSGKDYSISADLNRLPSMESKEMVVVLDRKQKTADIILPAGASLLVNNEVPGMNKTRIGIALKKEGVKMVSFYNAGGSLALKEPNSYYKDKEVTVSKLKQFTLLPLQTLDVASQAQEKKETKIEKFQAIQDSEGKYAFFIKPENEKSFSIYPMKEHLNAYFNVMGKDNKLQMHKALAQKYYDMAYRYPDAKQQLIMPNTDGIDMSRLEKVRICADKNDPKTKVVIATVDGERMQKPISKQQWYNLWLADDMDAYKRAVAAITFIPRINQSVQASLQPAQEREARTAAPQETPQKEEVQQEAKTHRGFHR